MSRVVEAVEAEGWMGVVHEAGGEAKQSETKAETEERKDDFVQ